MKKSKYALITPNYNLEMQLKIAAYIRNGSATLDDITKLAFLVEELDSELSKLGSALPFRWSQRGMSE